MNSVFCRFHLDLKMFDFLKFISPLKSTLIMLIRAVKNGTKLLELSLKVSIIDILRRDGSNYSNKEYNKSGNSPFRSLKF